MQLNATQSEMKELLKAALVEVIQEKREFFSDIFQEALEEIGLVKAIQEGRKNNFVDGNKILSLLEE